MQMLPAKKNPVVFILLIVVILFSSCGYYLPLVKFPVKKNTEMTGANCTDKSRRWLYISISRYGILGEGWKHIITDSAGRKIKTDVYKSSNLVSDGYTTDHHKTIEYDARGKITRKTKERSRERGWTIGGYKEKIIEFDSAGKRHVTKNNRNLWKFPKPVKGKKERVTF